MKQLERKITVRFSREIEQNMRLAMRQLGVAKSSDFVRQAVVRAINAHLRERSRPETRGAA